MFSIRFFKDVSEPPVPQHVQRKEHVFQSLTLEYILDLNKKLHNYYLRRNLTTTCILTKQLFKEIKCNVFIFCQCI